MYGSKNNIFGHCIIFSKSVISKSITFAIFKINLKYGIVKIHDTTEVM